MDPREHHLSDLLGAEVVDRSGRPLGRIRDLTLRLGDGDAVVGRMLVGARGRRPSVVIPVSAIDTLDRRRAVVDAESSALAGVPAPDALTSDELLLGRDVLDTQIVDLDGKRLVRVGDVLIAHHPTRGLTAIAVDIGFGAVCHRLGLRCLARRLDERVVPWDALHLTSARGHDVQLATPSAALHRLTAEEVGLLLDAVTTDAAIDIVRAVPADLAEAALDASQPHTAHRLRRAMHHPDSVPARRTRRHDGWQRRIPTRRRRA